ncbi:hypothetical protein [Sporosalibacterium faouarense]|uniref:hypothetical protein n=1 Tax=Sporosalibacterium faouarense TaxID=516123 RepID=UPI00141C8C8A|nr:hypothetical protein [Sporosalibacterium faouarense]MTI49671.1 hypothetical protein [Bacillota bacterium]
MGFNIYLIVVRIFSTILCYRIAKKRNRNPLLWGIIGLIFGIIGLILILSISDDQKDYTRTKHSVDARGKLDRF